MKKKHRNNKGFALVELNALLIIIGILATFAIPNFIVIRDGAIAIVCKSNMRTLTNLNMLWAVNAYPQGIGEASLTDLSPQLSDPVICPSGGSFSNDADGIWSCDKHSAAPVTLLSGE